MATVWYEDFENGTDGAVVTTSNTSAVNVGGQPTFTTQGVLWGTLAMQINASSQSIFIDSPVWSRTSVVAFDCAITVGALPAANVRYFNIRNGTASQGGVQIQASGVLVLQDANATRYTSTTNLTGGATYRVAARFDQGSKLCRLRIYNAAGTLLEDSGNQSFVNGAQADNLRYGQIASGTSLIRTDSILVDNADWPVRAVTTSGGVGVAWQVSAASEQAAAVESSGVVGVGWQVAASSTEVGVSSAPVGASFTLSGVSSAAAVSGGATGVGWRVDGVSSPVVVSAAAAAVAWRVSAATEVSSAASAPVATAWVVSGVASPSVTSNAAAGVAWSVAGTAAVTAESTGDAGVGWRVDAPAFPSLAADGSADVAWQIAGSADSTGAASTAALALSWNVAGVTTTVAASTGHIVVSWQPAGTPGLLKTTVRPHAGLTAVVRAVTARATQTHTRPTGTTSRPAGVTVRP